MLSTKATTSWSRGRFTFVEQSMITGMMQIVCRGPEYRAEQLIDVCNGHITDVPCANTSNDRLEGI